MRRSTLVLLAILSGGQATAQDAADQAAENAIDFVLRPTQGDADAFGDDFWIDQLEDAPPPADSILPRPIGPPLLGPVAAPIDPARPARLPREADGLVDPFAPAGFTAGTFVIRPSIEIGVSATDNVRGEEDGESAVGLLVAPAFNAISQDERHLIEADVRAAAIFYGDESIDEREAELRLRGRYDLTSRTSLKAEAGYSYDLDSYSDPDTPDGVAQRPAVHSLDAALGGTQLFGRHALGLTGTFERNVYDDATLAGGGTLSREELNNTQYGLRLRGGVEGEGLARPYVEVAAGRREYDLEEDSDGFARSSLWGELRGGLIFDFGSKLSGDIALGYRREEPDDEALEPVNAAIVDAAVFWSPQRLTEIRFDFTTDVDSTSLGDATASVTYTGQVTAARRIGARLRVEAGAGLEYETFVGGDRRDTTTFGLASATYALTRTASLAAAYRYEQLRSSDDGADYESNEISVRLRLQR